MTQLSRREISEMAQATRSGAPLVVFVHGLWLLASSWDRWRRLFEAHGYVTLAPSWPDEPDTVEEARRHPEQLAHQRLDRITEHCAAAIRGLHVKPAVVGHSFGGLVAQRLAGMGLSAVTVAIDPAPFRGVLPLPLSALKAALPVLGNPANFDRAVALTFEQFRFAFANASTEAEARQLYGSFLVAGSGRPLFQAATANLNPWTEAAVDTTNPARGPLLIVSGEQDHTVPSSMARASYRRQCRNPGVTELQSMPGRGHSLTIDGGWQAVAEAALAFVQRFRVPQAAGPWAAGAAPRPPESWADA